MDSFGDKLQNIPASFFLDTCLITELWDIYTETDEKEQETNKIVQGVDKLVESTRRKRKYGCG